MMSIFDPQRWAHTLRRRAKTFVGARPQLFFPLFRPRPAFDDLLVTESTDLRIEGFPRSANSFAVGAIRHTQPEPVQVAHHPHVPANAMRACEWGIPTVVLIRSPQDAIVSRVALGKETRMVGDEPPAPKQRVSFAAWVHAWYSFYRHLSWYREREQFLVAPFQHVIQDMGQVVERVNARFGTGLIPFSHSNEAVAAVQERQGYHAGPNDRRAQLKEETRADFEAALRKEATLREWMDEAERLHNLYLEAVGGE